MNEIRLEKENAGLRDRVAELEAALGMLVVGVNRGSVPIKHLKIIVDVIERMKPYSEAMLQKQLEYYE
jgi:hypothetical protein